MSKINELYLKYDSDTNKYDYEQTERLRSELESIKDGELQGAEEHKQYLELLRRFRIIVKKFTDLNGKNFLKTIKDLLGVGASGMYSSELRFLYELIQNVDDCEYADPANAKLDINCDFYHGDGKITFEYNEKGFTPFNVFAITGIAEQAKNLDPEKIEIGEKGLGFKTVFGLADSVLIQSGFFSFKLSAKDVTCPIPDYENFEFVEGTKLTLFMDAQKIENIFYKFMAEYKASNALLCKNPLLFLNKLSKLRVYFDARRSLKFTVERQFDLNTLSGFGKAEHVKLSYEDGEDVHEEISCTHYIMPIIYDRETCVSRYGQDTAFTTKKMNMQVIVPDVEYVKDKNGIKGGSFYSFLPTKVELPVPMVCHIPFKLNPSREHIDSQSGNKWFVYSYQAFSEMFDKVLKDLALTYKEDIVYYLPKKNVFLFKSDKEYADLELPCFKGEHFLTLPVFYTETGGFLPSDQVYAFSEPEKLQSVERVVELLNDKRHLFNASTTLIRWLNIEIIENVANKLFQIALSKPEYAEEIFNILNTYDGFCFEDRIKEQTIKLDAELVRAICVVDKCRAAFEKVAYDRLKGGRRPEFIFACDQEHVVDVRNVDDTLSIEADDFGDLVQSYFKYMKEHSCIVSDFMPEGKFFIAKNVLLLSKNKTMAALSAFCRKLDPKNIFASILDLRRCSRQLDEVDDSISAGDYLKTLRSVRKAICDAFGPDVYKNYISIINQAGTNPERYINELLQNADDCEYPAGERPEFRLEISKANAKKIETRYNEKGFTKENVRAITAIGESTKKKLMQGEKNAENLIGEKGVGFKSVFAVAERVEIYSGDFKFSLSQNMPTVPELLPLKKGCDAGTTMVFTLKEEMKSDFFSEEKVLSLCLCLRKLRTLKIGEYRVTINDKDGIRTIQINDKKYEYQIVVHQFTVDNKEALNERRGNKKNISEKQSILFYIPLNKSANKSFYLYSGLPTEIEVKIPLIIDAPFELDTARSNVIENKWNNYILDRFYEGLSKVLLKLSKTDGIDVLRFVETKKIYENSSLNYKVDIFSKANLNKNKFLITIKSLNILPTWEDNCFVSANERIYRVPGFVCYAFGNGTNIGEDLSGFLKYRGEKYDEVLNALEIKKLPLDKTIDLIKNFYSNYISDEIFYKSFYRYLEDHELSIYSIKNVLKNLKIIPVKGKVAGQTEYLSWNECVSNLYVKDSATVSRDTCWILKTDILEKPLCESLFGVTINELTRELEEYTYSKKLLEKLEESLPDEDLYNYLIGEFKNNYALFSKCQDGLLARKHLIPLKNQLGKFKKGNTYISQKEVGYFSGQLLPSHIVHKECESFAEFIRCGSIADIFHDDLDFDIQLSADDIEDLEDDYINNGYEILAYRVKNRTISSELIRQYGLEKLTDITVEYDEDIFNQPIDDVERFYKKLQERIDNPIKIEPREKKIMVRIGITTKGEEVPIDSDERRRYNARKYALASGYCVCQMCKKAKSINYIEVNNVEKLPKFYWEECGIVLCLECSKRFKELREDEELIKRFHRAIRQANVNSDQPIEIPIANQILTFSQKHLAEIQEILKKQDYIL